jgi:hypothetical protein
MAMEGSCLRQKKRLFQLGFKGAGTELLFVSWPGSG